MADIRIKDLTTTASSTASDDFFAADGTTNGTRKLSAYSPTFGGNATVSGTLTVSGSGTSAIGGMLKGAAATYSGNPPTGVTSAFQVDVENATTRDVLSFGDASRAGLLRGYHDGSGGIRWQFGRYAGGAYDEYARFEGTTAANGKLLIYGTTASTTTSSGALVVGNGTSGGLGVGGSIYLGGSIISESAAATFQMQGTGNTTGVKTINLLRSDGLDTLTIGLTGTAYAGVLNAGGLGNNEGYIYNAAPFRVFIGATSTNRFDFTSSQFKINPTTASNSTSSGALVIGNGTQGGLGVGGNAYIGGDLVVPGQGKAINAQGYFLFKGAYCNIFSRGTSGGWGTGIVFHSSNTDPSASIVHDPTTGDLTLYTNATASNYASTDRALLINTSKQVQVLSSTNSTGIASGALLVSGGVGVAGAVYAGGNIDASGGADFTSVAASFARISTVAAAPRLTLVRSGSTSNRRAFDIINNQDGLISMRFVNDDLSASTLAATISYTGDFRITGTLQVGNTYASGAPTATGYIVIKDSTGTSYKIPAVAL
jgi:hypothetical protein